MSEYGEAGNLDKFDWKEVYVMSTSSFAEQQYKGVYSFIDRSMPSEAEPSFVRRERRAMQCPSSLKYSLCKK